MDATLEPKTRRRSTHRPSEDDFVGSSPVERRPRPRSRQTAPARRGSYDITFDDENIALGMMDSSIWHDAPLFVAILPCLAAFVFGTEYVQDIILFLCICWYLHTAISLPWSLYEASRPRSMTRQARQNMTPQQITAHESLQWRSLWLLAFAFVAPFAGLVLIQQILKRASSSSNTYTTGGLLRRNSIPASNGAWSGRGSTSSNAAALQRRRSYDAPAPNLDTVVEEGPETDVDITSDRDILMMDLPGDNTPGHTISANGLRRRSQGVDGLENATSTSVNQTKAAGSASPFVRVYVEESRKTKGKHNFKTDGDSGVIEG
ncbi:hypothetical protein FRC18_001973 [Serendipita sp. 400]|nr:hypothetical protein FRC18_001973 [Serendipita sp. 400]